MSRPGAFSTFLETVNGGKMNLIPKELLDQLAETGKQMALITEYMNETCESLSTLISLIEEQNQILTDVRNK